MHLFAPLPFGFGRGTFGEYFRTHAFFNAGNINDSSFSSKSSLYFYRELERKKEENFIMKKSY